MLPMSEAVLSQNKVVDTVEDDDDMTCGDLGNGLVKRHSGLYEIEGFSAHASRPRGCSAGKSVSPLMLIKHEDSDVPVLRCSRCNSLSDIPFKKCGMNEFRTYSRQNSSESNSEASNEELKQQLQEVVEEVEILRVELEASQRQLEGKEQALKLLQSMAVLDKATSHTKAIFRKTEEQKKALEKELNVLQWEIKINQEKFKNIEEAWAEKYDSIYCENAALKETLKSKTEEIKSLKSEKEILDQEHLEILAMLDVKQQKIVQKNMSLSKSGLTEITGLEFELLKKSKEEAYIMADAFRIAFEQQLMRRKDQALRLAQMSKNCRKETKSLNWKHIKEDGAFRSQGIKKSLGERLKGMLVSGSDRKKLEELDNPHEIIRMLIDLLNDKEEILAHQRKVSYMLARTLEKKENGSQNRAKKLSEELPLRSSQCGNDSKPQEVAIPLCTCCQTYTVEDGSCSVSNTCSSRTLDCTSTNSHSTTSEENDNLEECNTN